MQSIDLEGKTVEEALEKALGILNRTKDEVEYEVLDEGSKGVLGVGARPILIRVRAKELPEMTKVKELVSEFMTKLEINCENIDVTLGKNDIVRVNLDTEDAGILIGKYGATLDAVQYLINQVMHETRFKYTIDVSDYREKQNAKLIEIVKRIASSVRHKKRKITLKPMSAYERRIVHETIKEFPDLVTKSIDVEPRRRVVISLLNPPKYERTERSNSGGGNRYQGHGNKRNYGGNNNSRYGGRNNNNRPPRRDGNSSGGGYSGGGYSGQRRSYNNNYNRNEGQEISDNS